MDRLRTKRAPASKAKPHGCRRSGAALVELAVTLPLILTIVLGTIEITSVVYTKQNLQSTAQECARVAAKQTSTDAQIETRLNDIAAQLGLRNVQVFTNPPSIEGLDPGTRIHVMLQADAPTNTFVAGNFYGAGGIVASCVVVKEL